MAKKKPTPPEEVCANCKFFVVDKEEDYGRCHRYPPVVVPEADLYSFEFPVVNEDDFCGEHKFHLQS